VWFASDADTNIYWFSSITRRHSQEVARDPHVAGSMCLPQTPADKPRGLQFEGTAEMLTDATDIQKAIDVYKDRVFPEPQIHEFINSAERPHKFYRVKPCLFVLFDVEHFPENSRQEWTPAP
jgi:uncharacterized protein YhbP (UPF0306 family)